MPLKPQMNADKQAHQVGLPGRSTKPPGVLFLNLRAQFFSNPICVYRRSSAVELNHPGINRDRRNLT
jgi:hypothetical protein